MQGLIFLVSCPGPSVKGGQTDLLMAAAGREGVSVQEQGNHNQACGSPVLSAVQSQELPDKATLNSPGTCFFPKYDKIQTA